MTVYRRHMAGRCSTVYARYCGTFLQQAEPSLLFLDVVEATALNFQNWDSTDHTNHLIPGLQRQVRLRLRDLFTRLDYPQLLLRLLCLFWLRHWRKLLCFPWLKLLVDGNIHYMTSSLGRCAILTRSIDKKCHDTGCLIVLNQLSWWCE